MRTKQISSYSQFIGAGRPYLPKIDKAGRLLLPNFDTSSGNMAIKHQRRLSIVSGVIYNRGGITAAWVSCYSCLGFRYRWLYWRGQQQISWHRLTWDEKIRVSRAYAKRRETLSLYFAPSVHWQKWSTLQ